MWPTCICLCFCFFTPLLAHILDDRTQTTTQTNIYTTEKCASHIYIPSSQRRADEEKANGHGYDGTVVSAMEETALFVLFTLEFVGVRAQLACYMWVGIQKKRCVLVRTIGHTCSGSMGLNTMYGKYGY